MKIRDQIQVIAYGPRGAPGRDGEDLTITREAGENISALRVVYEKDAKVFKLSPFDALNINNILGIAVSSAATGGNVIIKRVGVIDDDFFNFMLGRIYLDNDGKLSNSPPQSGYNILIGTATLPTRLVLNIQDPIKL